jgi:hypothetical protein
MMPLYVSVKRYSKIAENSMDLLARIRDGGELPPGNAYGRYF